MKLHSDRQTFGSLLLWLPHEWFMLFGLCTESMLQFLSHNWIELMTCTVLSRNATINTMFGLILRAIDSKRKLRQHLIEHENWSALSKWRSFSNEKNAKNTLKSSQIDCCIEKQAWYEQWPTFTDLCWCTNPKSRQCWFAIAEWSHNRAIISGIWLFTSNNVHSMNANTVNEALFHPIEASISSLSEYWCETINTQLIFTYNLSWSRYTSVVINNKGKIGTKRWDGRALFKFLTVSFVFFFCVFRFELDVDCRTCVCWNASAFNSLDCVANSSHTETERRLARTLSGRSEVSENKGNFVAFSAPHNICLIQCK